MDCTNQDYVVEDVKNAGIDNVEGVHFTLPQKQEVATLLKERMINNKFWFPYFTWERPYRGEFMTELNVERFELHKNGNIASTILRARMTMCFGLLRLPYTQPWR